MLVGDLNADLVRPEGSRQDKAIDVALADKGLEDMVGHFLPCRNPWEWCGRTWSMLHQGREVLHQGR